MDTKLRISVVIPTYGTRERTLQCLAALWLCNPQPDEVIVVDDESPDNTAPSVLRKYPHHIVVRLPTRRGLAAAANHGLARASGDLLFLLDSDTEVDGSAIGAVLSAFEARDDLGVAGAALRYPNGGRRWSGGRLPGSLWCFAQASGLPSILEHTKLWRWLRSHPVSRTGRVDWVAGTAMVVRRSLWEEIGPFDLGYRLSGQYIDLCCNAADAGSKIEIIPGFGVVYPASGSTSYEGFAPRISVDELMWADLVHFADKRKGDAGARRSGRALQLGGRLRLFGRRMATPLVPWERKEEWQAETIACAQALRSVDAAFTRHRPQP